MLYLLIVHWNVKNLSDKPVHIFKVQYSAAHQHGYKIIYFLTQSLAWTDIVAQ